MLIAIIVIIGLSLLILGHEAGHFFVAKLFGLKVDEFGFGFPPRITAKKIGDTEYSLNWLPFGGFVKISGERGEFAMIEGGASNDGATPAEQKRLLYAQPAWKKSLIMLAGVFMNFLIGWFSLRATGMEKKFDHARGSFYEFPHWLVFDLADAYDRRATGARDRRRTEGITGGTSRSYAG